MGYVFDAIEQADQANGSDAAQPTSPAGVSSPVEASSGGTNRPPAWQPRAINLTAARLAQVDDRVVALKSPSAQQVEEYRNIRTSLLARWNNRTNLVHTLTSATPQEGKTITSVNLGLCFAELRNRRTLVLEADLRLPMVSNLLKIETGPQFPGLIHYLRGDATLPQIVHRLGESDGLDVIVAGDRAPNDAVHLLSHARMAELLATLRRQYDHVIIDTPPVVELADAGILGAMSDEVLLVARMNHTPRALVEQAVRTLHSYNAPLGGVIATDRTPIRGRYYAYHYGKRDGQHYGKNHAA